VIPAEWRSGEAAVIGLARSGVAAGRLLRKLGINVYASDVKQTPELGEGASALRAAGCDVELGRHDLARIARASVCVLSPGVPPDAPPILAAKRAGVSVVSELDLAARCLEGTKLIVTTGTKGKSSTAAMIGAILAGSKSGPREAYGNIGAALAEAALGPDRPAWLSVEASSFQLHDAPALDPAVGVVTNLSPDHLDRYPDAATYYADKKLLFRNAGAASRWVWNGDEPEVAALAAGAAGTHERFSLDVRLADAWFDRVGGWLVVRGLPLMRRADLALLGDHNVANALAAALAAPAELDRDVVAAALKGFRALHHRLEPVREVGGVLWVNDSKATTVSSALAAVRAMDRPVVLLLGGKDKGGDFGELASALKGARGVVAYGEAGERIARELNGRTSVSREGNDFGKVVARAKQMAKPGDAVLLAPACSSFDMFENAEQRGEEFTRLVKAM
jgi:UDP-N-acetylmuramoylalanine--D-glutamate ligase